jgi:hypothetical protein
MARNRTVPVASKRPPSRVSRTVRRVHRSAGTKSPGAGGSEVTCAAPVTWAGEAPEEIACGDAVVHRVMARGTHLGEFPPGIGPGRVLDAMPPAGRSFEADQMHIHRVRDGKITDHAGTRNDLLMVSQLGLLPGITPVSEAAWRTQLTPIPGHPPEPA